MYIFNGDTLGSTFNHILFILWHLHLLYYMYSVEAKCFNMGKQLMSGSYVTEDYFPGLCTEVNYGSNSGNDDNCSRFFFSLNWVEFDVVTMSCGWVTSSRLSNKNRITPQNISGNIIMISYTWSPNVYEVVWFMNLSLNCLNIWWNTNPKIKLLYVKSYIATTYVHVSGDMWEV